MATPSAYTPAQATPGLSPDASCTAYTSPDTPYAYATPNSPQGNTALAYANENYGVLFAKHMPSPRGIPLAARDTNVIIGQPQAIIKSNYHFAAVAAGQPHGYASATPTPTTASFAEGRFHSGLGIEVSAKACVGHAVNPSPLLPTPVSPAAVAAAQSSPCPVLTKSAKATKAIKASKARAADEARAVKKGKGTKGKADKKDKTTTKKNKRKTGALSPTEIEYALPPITVAELAAIPPPLPGQGPWLPPANFVVPTQDDRLWWFPRVDLEEEEEKKGLLAAGSF